jgi:hypothetical protein
MEVCKKRSKAIIYQRQHCLFNIPNKTEKVIVHKFSQVAKKDSIAKSGGGAYYISIISLNFLNKSQKELVTNSYSQKACQVKEKCLIKE